MDIFGQLGINTTSLIQFVIYSITLVFLSKVVFAPYSKALNERQNRTKGGEELALEFTGKAAELQSTYENKLRTLNSEIKEIIDSAKLVATKDYTTLVEAARGQAEQSVHANRTQIASSVQAASAELKSQTTAVAMAITHKLIK